MRTMTISKFIILVLCVGLVLTLTGDLCLAAMGYKGPENVPGQKMKAMSMTGEVSVLDPTYIGIITARDKNKGESVEMLFIIDEEVVFKKKAFEELMEGDIVKVTYEHLTKPDPDNEGEELFVRRITKEVQFLRAQSTSLKSGK